MNKVTAWVIVSVSIVILTGVVMVKVSGWAFLLLFFLPRIKQRKELKDIKD